MKWKLSDGTVVHLGGKVEGESLLATILRGDVEGIVSGDNPLNHYEFIPGGTVPLDLTVPLHVDSWIRDSSRCLGVPLVSAPELDRSYLEPEPGSDDPMMVR